MKKIGFLMLLILGLISVAYATNTIIVKDTTRPIIKATFNETVTLISANLTYTSNDQSISLDNKTTNYKVFNFTPRSALANGFYYFFVRAKDKIGNPKTYSDNVIVNVNETQVLFLTPKYGIATTETYDIVLQTTRNATCRWSYDSSQGYGDMSDFIRINDMTFKISNFKGPDIEIPIDEDAGLLPLYVKCKDDFGRNVSKTLYTGFDSSPPEILTFSAQPNPVISYPPRSTISIQSDDKVLCYANNKFFDNQSDSTENFAYQPIYSIQWPPSISSNNIYSYDVYCVNRAGLQSPHETKTIEVKLTAALAITINSPRRYINTIGVKYNINTNKPAACTAVTNNSAAKFADSRTLTTVDKLNHIAQGPNLNESLAYGVKFVCRGGDKNAEYAEKAQVFEWDKTAPQDPKFNVTACDKTKIMLSFSSNDPESGISGYNYSVTGPNVSIQWKFVPGTAFMTVTESNLNLAVNASYEAKVIARNGADSPSSSISKTFIFNPKTALECQEKNPPKINLKQTPTTFGVRVDLICTDDSGCLNGSIKYGTAANLVNCTATITGTTLDLYSPQAVCFEAKDIYQNIATGGQLIKFTPIGSTCNDKILDGIESDVDCGGNCLGCDIGLKCKLQSDCAENYCVSGLCKKPYCNDTIQDGFESDVDCGGSVCSRCEIGKKCAFDADCGTNFCSPDKTCQATSCDDMIKNGYETDVDCGGQDCNKCDTGKACLASSDCKSNMCQFSICSTGMLSWEEWAREHGLDPIADRDKEFDSSGLTNYEQYLKETGQSISEIGLASNIQSYLLLAIGVIILLLGIILLYYLKVDKSTSMNIIIVGAIALLLAIIDLWVIKMPSYLSIALCILVLSGAGYFVYLKKDEIMQKSGLSKRAIQMPKTQIRAMPETIQTSMDREKSGKEDQAATRTMIELIRKERMEREKKREDLFKKFGKEKPEANEQGRAALIEPIKKRKALKEASKTEISKIETGKSEKPEKIEKVSSKTERLPERKTDFERLSEITKRASNIDLDRFKKKEEAFEKLSKISKSRLEDVFSKLPSSHKKPGELEELNKRKKNKK